MEGPDRISCSTLQRAPSIGPNAGPRLLLDRTSASSQVPTNYAMDLQSDLRIFIWPLQTGDIFCFDLKLALYWLGRSACIFSSCVGLRLFFVRYGSCVGQGRTGCTDGTSSGRLAFFLPALWIVCREGTGRDSTQRTDGMDGRDRTGRTG